MTAVEVIHHLVPAGEWQALTTDSLTYTPTSLATEGFIHFSTMQQIPATSLRYYADVPELLVVSVEVAALDGELRWEDLAGTGVYPHLYAALNLDAVQAVQPYEAGDAFSDVMPARRRPRR